MVRESESLNAVIGKKRLFWGEKKVVLGWRCWINCTTMSNQALFFTCCLFSLSLYLSSLISVMKNQAPTGIDYDKTFKIIMDLTENFFSTCHFCCSEGKYSPTQAILWKTCSFFFNSGSIPIVVHYDSIPYLLASKSVWLVHRIYPNKSIYWLF